MSVVNNEPISKTTLNTFPVTENFTLPKSIFVELCNNESSPNSVDFLLVDSAETVRLAPGQSKEFNATSNAIEGDIDITFYGPASININYTDGDQAAPPPSAGDATAANQVILQNYINGTTPSTLSGQTDTTSVVEDAVAGTRSTDTALAYSIKFYGTGGEIDGNPVENGYIADFGTNNRNQVSGIPYTVPTGADPTTGFQKVLITYIKI